VTVTDAVGCDTTFTFELTDPPALQLQVDGITPAACNTSADGAVQVSASGGTGQLQFGWTGPGGFTSDQEDITDLAPGDYLLTVTDANGCAIAQGVTVPALNSVVADAGPDLSQCTGTAIILNASGSQGATSFTWADGQGTPLGQGITLDLGTLAPGAYSVVLTAISGPCIDQDTVLINILALPLADAGPDQTILIGATVSLGGVPGPPGSTYLWSPDSLVSSPTILDPTTSPDATTWFVLQVTTDAGCADVDSVLITVVPEIVIPTGFSPNSDGRNDAWQIDNIDLFPDCRVEIYSRWGELLFTSDGYPVPWDGTYNGGLVPVGTYYYAIELNDPRFPEPYTGPLTVIR
jgi:gliding motility-associated-like protein